METIPPDMSLETTISAGTPIERSDAIPIVPTPRLRGRARIMQGLQRISSTPTLMQLAKRANGNPYSVRSSLSCVSLTSPSSPRNYDNSYSSQSSGGGYSTAPTSASSSPGVDTPFFDGTYNRMASRKVEYAQPLTPGFSSPTSPLPFAASKGLSPFPEHSAIPELVEDYFSLPISDVEPVCREKLDFWGEMPYEIKLTIFAHLEPKQLVRASGVSKEFYKMCFDGQLWTSFDASPFYQEIPAESLAKIIVAAGPFIKDLNLRGCVQVEHYKRAEVVVKACKNLINATLEGCKNFQRSSLHSLLKTNERLANLNLTGLTSVTNGTCKIIGQSCPSLEALNVSWCTSMDARGIKTVILGCPMLKDLRAREVTGFQNLEVAQAIFETNRLEKLILNGCCEITDEALKTMITGRDPEIDILTDLPLVPPRKLRHLDLSHCTQLSSVGLQILNSMVPSLEGLQLSGCTALTDTALIGLLATTPQLTHLDIEDLGELTNNILSEHLAKSPCASTLEYLTISNCENLGDSGMLPVIRACTSLKCIDVDNTRISDLVLAEAAAMVRSRSSRTSCPHSRPRIGLRMMVFDCQNVTWTGIREVLSRNAEVRKPSNSAFSILNPTIHMEATYPTEIISLKCFYGWHGTVQEHTRRVLRGDLPAAGRLERKWAEYMMANEEAGAGGAGIRRRRRRAREAQMMHADEEVGLEGAGGVGRRRRARSNGCAVM
jgi:F-box/leucine-rich repeat protein 2/20